jgi:eukaryotic-like serine/threonine-protein kinase
LAVAFRKLNQLEKAITRGEEALELRRNVLGATHPHTLIAMNNLAITYDEADRPGDARKLFEDVLRLATGSLGREHPDTLRAMLNLGASYREGGEPDQALPLLKDALELMKKVLDPDHPDALTCADHLAGTYFALKRPEQALAVLERLVPAQRKRWGADELRFASFLARFGRELIGAGRDHEAEQLLNECLTIRRAREPEAWTTFEAELLLGCSHFNRDEFTAAEEHFLRCYEGLKPQEPTLPAKGKVLLPGAAWQLSELYAAWNRLDDAAAWRNELAGYSRKKAP